MTETGAEWPQQAPSLDPRLEGIAAVGIIGADGVEAGSPEDTRQQTIDGASARVKAAVEAGRNVPIFDRLASIGSNVKVIGGVVMVLGSSQAHPLRLGTGERNLNSAEGGEN